VIAALGLLLIGATLIAAYVYADWHVREIRAEIILHQTSSPPASRCRHYKAPEPVEVHDRLDGRPEVVAWLCPDCYEVRRPPAPPWPADLAALGIHRWGGVTTEDAAESIHRRLLQERHRNL
jgi:hypothetical protein